MNLEQLQRAMGAAVMQPLTADEQMRETTLAGRPMDEVAGEFIRPNDRLTAFERLEIYNRQYWFRLQGAFAEDFAALRAVVGDERFEALTNAYLLAHPSRSFTLRNLGAKMHDWLDENPSFAGPRIALAKDVIKVEWACIEAFDNADLEPLSAEGVSRIGGESRLMLQPHVRLLALDYPADDLVLEMHQRERRESTEAGTKPEFDRLEPIARLQLSRRATWLAIHRSDYSLYYKRLTKPEYLMLCGLRDGLTLAEALDAGFAGSRLTVATRISKVQGWFAHWAELGWLCSSSDNQNVEVV